MWPIRRDVVPWPNWDFISKALSNAPELTHLYVGVQSVVQIDFLRCFWPKLEHLTIQNAIINSSISDPDPEELRSFFSRHPNLVTISLPPTSYPETFDHYITEGVLPELRSFHYDDTDNVRVDEFPAFCQLLSPSSVRNLTHLTIHLVDAARLVLHKGFYGQLKNLETCILVRNHSGHGKLEGLLRILEDFVAHATKIRCLHIPQTRRMPVSSKSIEIKYHKSEQPPDTSTAN